jgi:hypothetical protein
LLKTVRQANKKINGTKAALVPSLTFTCYLNSRAAGTVSAATYQRYKHFPEIWFCNKCQKKVDNKIFLCEKAISIRDFQSKYWNALRTGLVL